MQVFQDVFTSMYICTHTFIYNNKMDFSNLHSIYMTGDIHLITLLQIIGE